MKLIKRAISLLLTLLMVVGCLSGLSLTASAASYNVWVLGKQVTDRNKNDVLEDGGAVRYNPSLGILYLTNAGVLSGQTQNHSGAVIYASGNLTLELSGNTTVQATNNGVYTGGDLSIHGDGKLIAYGNDSAINVFGTLYLDDEDSDPTVVAQGTAYGIKANSAVLLHGNLTAQTSGGGGTSGTVPNAALYVTGGKLELGSSDPRVFRNNLNLTLIGHDSLPAPDGSPALYAADGIEISSCLNVTAPEDYQLSSDHCRLLTGSGKDATNITVQPKQYYRIQLTGDGGTVTSDQPGDQAFPGQRVTLNLVPDEGCSLVDLVCLDGDGNPIALSHTGSAYSFLMPENSAEIYAFFDTGITYAVDNALDMEHGVVIPDYNRQIEGETVTLTVVPDGGYALLAGTLSVKDVGGTDVQLTDEGNDTYSFTMPASDVTVYAEFEMVGGLYVCGVEVTPENAADILGNGSASYNYETCTLFVNGLPRDRDLHEDAVIWTILPELTISGYGIIEKSGSSGSYGIFAENTDLTLSGSLNIGEATGVKAKSLRVRNVSNLLQVRSAQISGKVTVDNDVAILTITKSLYCQELVLGAQEHIFYPEGATPASVINCTMEYVQIRHGEKHTITVTDSFYGTVTADKTEASSNDTVHLTVTADAGCGFDSLTVTDANGDPVTVWNNSWFSMPDSDVTVSASFHINAPTESTAYDLWIGETQVTNANCTNIPSRTSSGKVSYNPATQTLYFEDYVKPEFTNNWHSDHLISTDSIDLTIAGNGDIRSFSRDMFSIYAPYNNVTIRGNFKLGEVNAKNLTFDGGTTEISRYSGTWLQVPGVTTVTNRNEKLIMVPGYSWYTPTSGTFALGDLQQITQGGPLVEDLPQPTNSTIEIRRRPENTVTVEEAVGGWVTAPSRTAYETHYVDLTIEPEDGYALQSLTVTDANGSPVDVTVSGSSATFRMPASAVTVTPVFMRGYAVRVASATHGSVTAEKIAYTVGETVTLTVSPAGGYELNELTVFAANGRPVVLTQDPTDQSVYTFTMPGCDVTVAARFARGRYTVNVSKTGNGSYTISDTVARFGDTVTLTTTPEPGYSVQSVTVNSSDTEVTQDGNSYSFIMPAANVTVTVRFVHTLHTVTVEATEHGTVTADKAGAYYGDTVTLTVTPDRSYLCTGLALLYDGSAHPVTLSGNTCSFTMPDADVSIAASFTSPDFRINVNAEHGTVTASPNPAKYTDTVTLTATPDTGYRLTDLCVEEDSLVTIPNVTPSLTALHGNRISGNEEYYRLVDGNTQTRWIPNEAPSATNPYIVIKTNQPVCLTEYTLTEASDISYFPDSRWKSWTIYGANFDSDSDATQNSDAWQVVAVIVDDTLLQPVNFATATYTLDAPAAQYQYYKIVVNASQGSSRVRMGEFSMRGLLMAPHDEANNDWTFTMPAKDVTVTAEFTPIDYKIIVGEQAHAVTTVPGTAHYGDRVQPTATVDEGWSLLGFTVTDEDGTVLPTYADNSFDMPAKSVTVTPRLGAASYTLAVLPAEHGTVTASQTIANCGDEITFTVTPDEGYVLDRLTVMDFSYRPVYQSNAANEYTFTMPAKNLMVTAKFAQGRYSITTAGDEHGKIYANPSAADAGMTVTIEEAPDSGYAMSTLTVTDANGNPISVENDQFTMPASDVTVTASFKAIDYNVTVTPGTNGTITADKATAKMGDTVTLTANPNKGYNFISYTVTDANGDPVTVTGSTFTMPASNVTVTATFEGVKYTVTPVQSDGGTLSADKGEAMFEETVTLTATPDAGYTLMGYTVTYEGNRTVPVENGQFIMPNANVTVTARFGTPVPYVDARGNAMVPAVARSISADTAELTAGWWFVTGSVTNNNRLTVSGSVNLILCDGATLTVPSGICVSGGNSLTVWAQSHGDGRGKLIAQAAEHNAAIGGNNQGSFGAVIINGGNITATGGKRGAGIGTGQNSQGNSGKIEIHNGVITATGGMDSAGIGGGQVTGGGNGNRGNLDSITITGGEVTATGLHDAAGIGGGGADNGSSSNRGGSLNSITITGGKITANGNGGGYGIGPGLCPISSNHTGTVGSVVFGWSKTTDFIQSSKNVSADKLTLVKDFYIDGDPLVDAAADNIQNACKLIPKLDTPSTYNVSIVSGITHGTVIADASTAYAGETVFLTVTPNEGYELGTLTVTDANGDPVAAANNQFIMPDSDVTVTATFTAANYNVTVTPATNGTVTSDKATAQYGETVTLTVTPDEGYELDALTVTDANGNPVPVENNQFTMPAKDVTVTATFTAANYNVTVTPTTNGTVTANPETAHAGDMVTLTATPNTGYRLTGVKVDDKDITYTPSLTYLRGSAEGTDNGKTRMLLDGDVNTKWYSSMSASPYIIFKADSAFRLTDYTLTTGADTASFGRRNWQDWTIYGANFASDEEAVPDSAAWQTVVSVTGDTTMQAVNCTPYTFTLDEAASSYQYYKIVITASRTNNDMQMAELTMRGLLTATQSSSGSEWTFTMPAKDVTVTASFTAIDYNVTVTPATNGTVTADKEAAHVGDEITLTVTPDEGYKLDTLSVTYGENETVTVENNKFTMPAADVTVTATFKASAPVTYTYFVGNSLTLEGDIGVNFYVKLNDVDPANARVEFAWGSGSKAGTQSAALADLTADANGRYKLTVRVAAAQMTDTITAELYDGETPVATQQYSVAKYARYVLGATDAQLLPLVENNADKAQKLRNLCKAMLIYGGKSQQQFKYNTYAPADQNLEYMLSDIPDGVLGTTTFPEGFEDTCGIQFYAASLILESRTTYRLYFTVTDQAKLDALGMEYGTSGSYVYFDIANISATDVFKDHSMSFGGLTVTANAGTYATAVLSGENETLKDVVKALYWYSDAAKTFFGVQ